jgi:hypothetical protein
METLRKRVEEKIATIECLVRKKTHHKVALAQKMKDNAIKFASNFLPLKELYNELPASYDSLKKNFVDKANASGLENILSATLKKERVRARGSGVESEGGKVESIKSILIHTTLLYGRLCFRLHRCFLV